MVGWLVGKVILRPVLARIVPLFQVTVPVRSLRINSLGSYLRISYCEATSARPSNLWTVSQKLSMLFD
jgi:hypothetical protein